MPDHNTHPTRRRLIDLTLACLIASLAACAIGDRPAQNLEAERYAGEGRRLANEGLTDEALALFEKAIELNPNLTKAHIQIGHIQRDQGNLLVAGESYERATKTNPNSFDAHYYLGLMRQMTGRLSHAVVSYLRAIAIDPDSFPAHHHLASAYLQLKQPADALPYATRATEINPDNQNAWANLAATYSLLDRHTQAIDAFREAVELGDLAEPILLGLANSHAKLGHYEQAKIVLESLIKQGKSSTAHERLGFVYFKMRRPEKALESYLNALAINPNDTAALNGKGVCLMTRYLRSGRADTEDAHAALDAWRQSLKLRPTQPRIVSLLTRYQRL